MPLPHECIFTAHTSVYLRPAVLESLNNRSCLTLPFLKLADTSRSLSSDAPWLLPSVPSDRSLLGEFVSLSVTKCPQGRKAYEGSQTLGVEIWECGSSEGTSTEGI